MNQPSFSELVLDTFARAANSEFGRPLICPGGLFEVVEEDVLGERMAVFKSREKSIFNLLRNTTANAPDREYVADGERRLTYREHMVAVGNLAPAVKHLLYEAFPSGMDGMLMGYTSTESCGAVAVIRGPAFEEHLESTGPVQDGVQVRIRAEEGSDLPDGSEGLITVRSPYTMLEFWNDPAATATVYAPGRWLNMGDVGRIENCLLYINSRARDVIFVSSENVFPTEVENRLEEHHAVVEACVAGIDDPVTGQAVKAFVVLGDMSAADEAGLTKWCRGGLPAYKVPTSWELGTESLPRNAAGKIQRNQLVAE